MSEVMDREQQTGTVQAAPEAAPPPAPEAEKTSLWKKWKEMPRKKRRKIVRWFLTLLILTAIGLGVWKFLSAKKGGDETEILTDVVQYNSITPDL